MSPERETEKTLNKISTNEAVILRSEWAHKSATASISCEIWFGGDTFCLPLEHSNLNSWVRNHSLLSAHTQLTCECRGTYQ